MLRSKCQRADGSVMIPPSTCYVLLYMTVAAALQFNESAESRSKPSDVPAYLVVREDQRVSQHDILSSASSKDNHLSNVVWCQRLTASINCISFGLVASKSDNREFLSPTSAPRHLPNPFHM